MGVVGRARVISRNIDADFSPPLTTRSIRRETPGEPAGVHRSSRLAGLIERNALVIVALAACAALLASSVRTATGPDTWYSLMAGRLIWNNGLPHHDTLTSLTLGRTWVDQEWLGHLGIYGLFAAGGWALALLTGVLGYTAAFAVSAVGARRRGASERTVALVTFGAFLGGGSNTELRAQTFAYVLFALTLLLLLGRRPRAVTTRVSDPAAARPLGERARVGSARRSSRRALRGVLGRARRAAASAGGTLGASGRCAPDRTLGLRPRLAVGFELPGYYRRVLGNPALRRAASEWARSTPGNQPVFFVLLPFGRRRCRRGSTRCPLAVPSRRPRLDGRPRRRCGPERDWFALAIAAILPGALDSAWRPSDAPRRRDFNLRWRSAAWSSPWRCGVGRGCSADAWVAHAYPPRLAAAAKRAASARPGARIFVDEAWADWLLYEDPSLAGRIAYDIRYELFTERELDRIVAFQTEQGPDWQTVGAAVRLLVLDPARTRAP